MRDRLPLALAIACTAAAGAAVIWMAWPTEEVVVMPASRPALQTGQTGGAIRARRGAASPEARRKEANARAILHLVGAQREATEAWTAAISDPSLPDDARQNLIEDLNEVGFADPRRLTRGDLPLIVQRIQLIDRLAPHAMDATNAAAFKEARKDLVEMQSRVTQH